MSSVSANWVDLVIILILIYFISEAWRVGFWVILADFVSFFLSLLIALRAYKFAADFIRLNFALTHSVSNALGFLLTAVIVEGALGFFLTLLISKIPTKYWKTSWNKIMGILPALGEGLVLVSFILTLIIGLPLSPKIKKDVTNSKIGGFLVQKTTGVEKSLNEIFGGVIEDSLTYLTIKPGSDETISLSVDVTTLTPDEESEKQMLMLVNKERKDRGVHELEWNPDLVPIARSHAEDMWIRAYFGHISPDGEDVGDRLEKNSIDYLIAGENLALAPTLQTAHTGLMNSEGHKANILEKEFGTIGIGIIDNGIYGKMFVQIFTN